MPSQKERLYLFDTTLRARVARRREALSTRKQETSVARRREALSTRKQEKAVAGTSHV